MMPMRVHSASHSSMLWLVSSTVCPAGQHVSRRRGWSTADVIQGGAVDLSTEHHASHSCMLWLVSSTVCNAAAGHGELAAGRRTADSSKAVPRAAAAPHGASQLRAVPGVGARAVAEKTRECSRTCGDDLALEDAPQEVARRRVHACRREQRESIPVLHFSHPTLPLCLTRPVGGSIQAQSSTDRETQQVRTVDARRA